MGKRAARASRAPIPSSQPLKRPRASNHAKSSSPVRLKRPRTPDDAPPGLCSDDAEIPSSQRLKRPRATRAASQAKISSSSLLLKRPRILDDAPPGLCSCSDYAAEIPSPRLPKKKTLRGPCSIAQIHFPFPSWGAKRARTARRPNRRDWANLEDGPAGLIAELVLANDVADYIHFRTVCRPWRRCSANPRACGVLDRRFHPRRWIMLQENHANPQSHRFLNVSTGQCIQVDLPELLDHHLLQSTAEGLLVLLCRTTNVIRLLNPLTRQVTELPQITTSLASEFRGGTPDNAGLADDHTVLLYFCRIGTLAFAKPGDGHWMLVKFDKLLMPTMSFQGRFYGVTTDAVMVVDTRESLPPRLVVAAKLAKPFSRMADTVHLVDNGGDLILVHSKICELPGVEDCFKRKYKVYRLDLDAGKATRVHSLSGRAVFIGRFRSLSVSPQVFPYIRSETVYPGFNLVERTGYERIGAYSLKDGSIEPSNSNAQSRLAHPWSIADLLVAHVSG
ncbi:unnamed protein product [Urochloa humidicola]